MPVYGKPMDQLLDMAVAHELAHALCHETSEWKTIEAEGGSSRSRNRHARPACDHWRIIAGSKQCKDLFIRPLTGSQKRATHDRAIALYMRSLRPERSGISLVRNICGCSPSRWFRLHQN